MKKFNPSDPITEPTVFFIFKKSCPACGPMKELVKALRPSCTSLEFIEVEAAGDNLHFCCDQGVDRTPAVVVFGHEYWGPYYDPVTVSEKLERAQKECERGRERIQDLKECPTTTTTSKTAS